MDKFQPGATVQLKSGGPLMTLGLKDQNGWWDCEWFDDNKQVQHRRFLESSLKLDDGSDIRV